MTMTRRDYKWIAKALNLALHESPQVGGTTKTGVLKAATTLADALHAASDWSIEGDRRFDRAWFMEEVTKDATGPQVAP